MASEKIFLLDTNVLIHDPEAINSFKNAMVAIPITVLEELDKFKSEMNDRGFSSRKVVRQLDLLRQKGSLKEGVQLENGAMLKVLFMPEGSTQLPLLPDSPDNRILFLALSLKQQGYNVQFISKDLNARVKADVLGIESHDYLKDNISKETVFKGWINVQVPSIELKDNMPSLLNEIVEEFDLMINEFVLLESKNNPFNYRIFRYLGNKQFKSVHDPALRWGIKARNPQQVMALDLLLDPEVELVSLIGPAGTGKTFLALLAGLDQTIIQDQYKKVLISRPVIPLGPDIGYLPGTIEEKLHSWMQPIYDNMEFITHAANVGSESYHPKEDFFSNKRNKCVKEKHKRHKNLPTLDELIKDNKISLEAITYMRGRSIPFQYILIDEVQNLTLHEVKTLISRVGEGSKIILAGDPYQIDSPYLDFSSNGLIVASNKFKGQQLFGTVFLENSERSQLSKLVSELL